MHSIPAHKQTDPAKKPGQIIHPLDVQCMDDTIEFTECKFCGFMMESPCGSPPPVMCSMMNEHMLREQAERAKAIDEMVRDCMCKDRPASQCPGEWEPGCDLGANEKFVTSGSDKSTHGGYPG